MIRDHLIVVLLTMILGAFALPWVTRVALWWQLLLTLGLPSAIADRRWMEVYSDIEEHRCALAAQAYGPHLMAFHILWRWVRGIPADLLWRFTDAPLEARAYRRPGRFYVNGISAASDGRTYYNVETHRLTSNWTYGHLPTRDSKSDVRIFTREPFRYRRLWRLG